MPGRKDPQGWGRSGGQERSWELAQRCTQRVATHPIPPNEPSWLTTGICKTGPRGPAGVAVRAWCAVVGAWRGGGNVAWQWEHGMAGGVARQGARRGRWGRGVVRPWCVGACRAMVGAWRGDGRGMAGGGVARWWGRGTVVGTWHGGWGHGVARGVAGWGVWHGEGAWRGDGGLA